MPPRNSFACRRSELDPAAYAASGDLMASWVHDTVTGAPNAFGAGAARQRRRTIRSRALRSAASCLVAVSCTPTSSEGIDVWRLAIKFGMMSTKSIPDGYDALIPCAIVRDAAKAIEFYKDVFGATELMRMPYADGQKIAHAEIKIRNHVLMLGDENPKMRSEEH